MNRLALGGGPDWLDRFLDTHLEELVAFRRSLHAHPELSGVEFETTATIVERLRVADLAALVLPSGTGLVCDLDPIGGDQSHLSAPEGVVRERVALRADIDALAMTDDKEVPYRSTRPGVAHACGHDVHTAMVLGAGLALEGAVRSGLVPPGSVRLIFEPSEESVPGGAVEVIEVGGLAGVGAVVGLHCDPKAEVGSVSLRDGPITWASDMITLELGGPGGHTARPDRTVDLTALAARLVLEVPQRVAAWAGAEVLVVFGACNLGDAANVIPAHGVLRGTLRTPDHRVWEGSRELVERAVAEILDESGAARDGASVTVGYRVGVPPVVNDLGVNAAIRSAASRIVGEGSVGVAEHSRGGDSFAWYARSVPAAYARLGTHDPRWSGPLLDIHSGCFDVDERCIEVGVRVLVGATLELLGGFRAW